MKGIKNVGERRHAKLLEHKKQLSIDKQYIRPNFFYQYTFRKQYYLSINGFFIVKVKSRIFVFNPYPFVSYSISVIKFKKL